MARYDMVVASNSVEAVVDVIAVVCKKIIVLWMASLPWLKGCGLFGWCQD